MNENSTLNVVIDVAKVLSPQQTNIVRLLAAGKSVPQVAEHLGIKPSTINRSHMRLIRKRLGVRTCAELRSAILQADRWAA